MNSNDEMTETQMLKINATIALISFEQTTAAWALLMPTEKLDRVIMLLSTGPDGQADQFDYLWGRTQKTINLLAAQILRQAKKAAAT